MGQEDVASLLNHMAPDDRTWFLGELPANVTKQLLALLTPLRWTPSFACWCARCCRGATLVNR